MSALTELRDRLVKATGPDELLDEALRVLVGAEKVINATGGNGLMETDDWYEAPLYTASLDAAVTLVPEGYRWEIGIAYAPNTASAHIFPRGRDGNSRVHYAATPALALCRARIEYELAKAAREPASRGEADSNHPPAFPNGRWG